MPRKVFWDDPYQTTLETRIASVRGAQVTLEATIFYAFSGGQESDAGSIAGQPVLAAQKDGMRDRLYAGAAARPAAPGRRCGSRSTGPGATA